MRTIMKASLLVMLAMTLSVPMLAQDPAHPPGRTIDWIINLTSPVADGATGTAHYMSFTPMTAGGRTQNRFFVECEYLVFPVAGTVLDVFLRMPANPTANVEDKYIGRMVVQNGSAALLLLTANAPIITKGTKVIVTIHDGPPLMLGSF